jgi:opine dehydrogenase
MKPIIGVFGNQTISTGHGIAADLTLAGYKVNFFDLPRFGEMIGPVQRLGGFHVTGNTKGLVSGKTGFAKPNMITTDPEQALQEVDVLFIDVPSFEYEDRFRSIAPFIKEGAIVNFNSYGYWSSLRVAPILKELGKKNIILTECPAPIYVAMSREGNIDYSQMRMGIPLSVFPSKRSGEAFGVLKRIYPSFEPAKNVLQTNFENLNMLGHAGTALLNIAYFDRAKEHGDLLVYFYQTGITEHTGLLTEAQDKERIAMCHAYDVPYTSFVDFLKRYYGANGKTTAETQLNSKFIQTRPPFSPDMGNIWLSIDLPLATVPLVLLADLAGVSLPIYRGMINIFGAVLKTDFWKTGLTLNRLGLAGLSAEEVIEYVTEG